MDPETKRKIKDYILKEYNKGYTYNAIEKVLINSGYDKADVERLVREIVREPIKSRLIKGLPFLILSLIIIVNDGLFACPPFHSNYVSAAGTEFLRQMQNYYTGSQAHEGHAAFEAPVSNPMN